MSLIDALNCIIKDIPEDLKDFLNSKMGELANVNEFSCEDFSVWQLGEIVRHLEITKKRLKMSSGHKIESWLNAQKTFIEKSTKDSECEVWQAYFCHEGYRSEYLINVSSMEFIKSVNPIP